MNVGIISQARMTSTRLPGKVLLPAAGKPMLQHHVDRLRAAGYPIIIATTTNATDEPLVAFAERNQLPWYRGSEADVLSRFAGAAQQAQLDVVVRVTSDCPLIDGELIRAGVEQFLARKQPALYLSNTLPPRTWPRGMDFEVFWNQDLQLAAQQAVLPGDREHVTPYLHQNRTGAMQLVPFARGEDASQYRLTLDEPDDYQLLRTLMEAHQAHQLPAEALVALMDAHPELAAINAHVEQKKV